MTSRADEVQEHIADLSELITAAQKNLVVLGEDREHYAKARRANLQATIETLQRELARAKIALGRAQSLDAAAEILAAVKTQAREGRRTAKLANPGPGPIGAGTRRRAGGS